MELARPKPDPIPNQHARSSPSTYKNADDLGITGVSLLTTFLLHLPTSCRRRQVQQRALDLLDSMPNQRGIGGLDGGRD